MLIDNNNVSAHDQMLHSPVVSFLGDPGASSASTVGFSETKKIWRWDNLRIRALPTIRAMRVWRRSPEQSLRA